MTGEEKSEEQIHQEAMEEWLGVLAQLWTAAGKLIDADRLELYGRLLEEVPRAAGARRGALSARTSTRPCPHRAPSGALREELGDPHDLHAALERWREGWWE